ncbi:hypothetical protein BLNAU_16959 [Blattamonas nauphoetae]|uniref:Uncharacterized protein n=1 Tax=Blattamonas nauphoetae TaxID=2049346 RepID=A0ABQ9XCS2_9EUKA|nr:hypothetical protein BLNAU_16959 [Blattamonas nauphoetae]
MRLFLSVTQSASNTHALSRQITANGGTRAVEKYGGIFAATTPRTCLRGLVLSAVLPVLAQQGPPPLPEHVFPCRSHFCLARVDDRAVRAATVGSARGHPRREDPEQTSRRNHADDDDDWKHNPRSPASFVSDQNSDVALKTASHTNSTKQRPPTPLPSSDHVVHTERLQAILSHYTAILAFIRSYGGGVSELRPEYFLKWAEYARFVADECLEPLPLSRPRRERDSLRCAEESGDEGDIIKLFVLSKVTLKRFKALPGIFKEEKQKEAPTKVIKLQNPSQRTLQHTVKLEDSAAFVLHTPHVTLESLNPGSVTVTVSPRFSNPIKATLLFITNNEGGGQVHQIAMKLVTKVLNPTPSRANSSCEDIDAWRLPQVSRNTQNTKRSRTVPTKHTAADAHQWSNRHHPGPIPTNLCGRAQMPCDVPRRRPGRVHSGDRRYLNHPRTVGVLHHYRTGRHSFSTGNHLPHKESPIELAHLAKLQIVLEQPQGLKKVFSTADGQKTDTSGGRVRLSFSFHPKQAGEYMCRVVLKSTLDLRIFDIKDIAQSPGMEATIDLQTIA